jgi:hypothetical protein
VLSQQYQAEAGETKSAIIATKPARAAKKEVFILVICSPPFNKSYNTSTNSLCHLKILSSYTSQSEN